MRLREGDTRKKPEGGDSRLRQSVILQLFLERSQTIFMGNSEKLSGCWKRARRGQILLAEHYLRAEDEAWGMVGGRNFQRACLGEEGNQSMVAPG